MDDATWYDAFNYLKDQGEDELAEAVAAASAAGRTALDALARRNAELQAELEQVGARRAEALRDIEAKRAELQALRIKCGALKLERRLLMGALCDAGGKVTMRDGRLDTIVVNKPFDGEPVLEVGTAAGEASDEA